MNTKRSGTEGTVSGKRGTTRPPKLAHAFFSVLIFGSVGPLVGLAGQLYRTPVPNGIQLQSLLAAVMFGFLVGGVAALLAGLLYCLFTLMVVATLPSVVVRAWQGAAIGALAGVAGWAVYFWPHLFKPDLAQTVTHITELSLLAGTVSGFVSGWLLPVGRASAARS